MFYLYLSIIIFILITVGYCLYKFKIFRVCVFVVILTLLGIFFYFKLTGNSSFFNFLFPPKDLWQDLATTDFDITKKGKYVLKFKNKYPGNHNVIILTEKAIKVATSYKINYKVILKLKVDGELYQYDIQNNKSPFWGIDYWSKKKYSVGFSIFNYKVPNDLPRNKEITLEIEIVKPDKEFEEKYGKQKLRITKSSDK